MRAVYPGSFDPPTVAHLAVVEAALTHVAEVQLVLSRDALGKGSGAVSVEARRSVLDAVARPRPGLAVSVTAARLLVDIAEEFDAEAVVMGADKLAQVLDPVWYGSIDARDVAIGRLPTVLLAERAGTPLGDIPDSLDLVVLDVDPVHRSVSATRARAGEVDLMTQEAIRSGLWTSPPT